MIKVNGIGIVDIPIDDSNRLCYSYWKEMIRRCYSKKERLKFKNYNNCVVSPCWIIFSNFLRWFELNFRYDLQYLSLNLDKDMLSINKDFKIYSPKTCCFIPKNINLFFTNIKSYNTTGCTGVVWDKYRRKWRAQIRDFSTGKTKNLGRYENKEDALRAYIKYRNKNISMVKMYLKSLGYNDIILNKIKFMEEI